MLQATIRASHHLAADDAVACIVDSKIFDLDFYRAQTGSDADLPQAIAHYLSSDEENGRLPNALFDPSHVKRQFTSHGRDSGGSTLLAYLQAPELAIDPHPLFDCSYYRETYGIPAGGKTDLEDYTTRCKSGALLLSPAALFDADFYCELYGDIPRTGMDAFRHYVMVGKKRGYQPHPLFHPAFFKSSLDALGIAAPSPPSLVDYYGQEDTWIAATHPLFDPAYYAAELETRGLAKVPRLPPLADMLRRKERITSHYLFDPGFYLRQAEIEGIDVRHPLCHYVRGNGRGGLDPHPLFHAQFYLEQLAAAAAEQCEPLQHYLATGWREGLDPNPLFSQKYYRAQCPDLRRGKQEPLRHYIEQGGRALRDTHPYFEAALYAAYHPDCLNGRDDPLSHYVRTWTERGLRFPPWGTRMVWRHGHARDLGAIDIVLVSHDFTLTGAPRILLRITEHLAKRRHLNLIVLTPRGGPLLEEFCEWASVLDMSSAADGQISPQEFLTRIGSSLSSRNRPKLILVNTACVPEIGEALSDTGIPAITLIHELASGFPYEVFKAIYDYSRLVIYPAEFVREEAHKLYPLPVARAAILPQGLLDPTFGRGDAEECRAMLLKEIGAPKNAFLVMGCGTLDLRKGVDVFARVAAATAAPARDGNQRPFHFIWVGEGAAHQHSPFWYVQQDVERSGIEDRVHFLGGKSDPEPYFLGCDAFIVTSRLDPFPCVVHEAMACAKPVIAFANAGGASEALNDNAGITVPYGDARAMADALCDLAANADLARAYGRRAKAAVHANYSFADYAEKILRTVEQRIGVTMAEQKHVVSADGRRGRVVFTVPDWNTSPINTFIGRLAQGLGARGFATEFVFTEIDGAVLDVARLPATPYWFVASSLRDPMGFHEKCNRLERSIRVATPAIYIHNLDVVGSAVAPILPKGIGCPRHSS